MEPLTLDTLRKQIDDADDALLQAFAERMSVVAEIGKEKKAEGRPIYDPARERQKLNEIVRRLPPELEQYGASLYSFLFALSRSYQSDVRTGPSPLRQEIERALASTPALFPPTATVACQGVEGAYSQLACEKLFKRPEIQYFRSFEAVFSAIESGFCDFGVLPVENSTAGSVKEVYDLMGRHRFHIVRAVRLKIDHALVARPGVSLADVHEVYSHPQAIGQCGAFLEKLGRDVVITPCENTAQAAALVAASGRTDVAAISSPTCAELYGLDVLAQDIQDRSNNYTRFICIAKDMQIYPGADKTSLALVLPHRPGALYQALSRFYALGLNLTKLESRPLPDREFEFLFYFDLETSVYSDEFIRLMDDLDGLAKEFQYLGSYHEVM